MASAAVYSVEVESALASHPDIADVAIVSRPDETFGETIIAVVTPVEGREVTLEGIRSFAAPYVSGYKLPRELVVRAIPRNPSGKTSSTCCEASSGRLPSPEARYLFEVRAAKHRRCSWPARGGLGLEQRVELFHEFGS